LAPEVAATPTPLEELLTALRTIIPIPGLLIVLPALYFFFRKTWRELDVDAQRERGDILARGKMDLRPFVAMPLCAIILTLQEYYGGRGYFDQVVHPLLLDFDLRHHHVLGTVKYEELWGFAWWAGSRIGGYVFVPFVIWKTVFPRDSLLDLGLRMRGFFKHIWIYGLFLAVVLPAMWIVSHEPDFGSYYPFYKTASRSWADFFMWEAMYFAQFFALEIFFRGFWLGVLRRSMGSAAIFAMAVPYCMIHFGKPYLEASAAIVAGIALGSLSMRTKSIYQGFMVHITVAALMDWLALKHRDALPKVMWAPPVETGAAAALLNPQMLRSAHYHAGMWLGVVALMLVAMTVSVIVSRVRLRRAWETWGRANGFDVVGAGVFGAPVIEEKTHDGIALRVALGSGMHTEMSAAALEARLLRFRLMRAGTRPPDGWQLAATLDTELDTHFTVAAESEESAKAAAQLVGGDVRRTLLALKARDVGVAYDRGNVTMTWPGADPDPTMLDAARQILLSLARQKSTGTYR
jgi:membrane protease YdiL (CAAX protease family)